MSTIVTNRHLVLIFGKSISKACGNDTNPGNIVLADLHVREEDGLARMQT